MIDLLLHLVDELNETLIQPRIHRFRVDMKLKLATLAVVGLFSLLGMVCLFLLVFLSIANATSQQEAAAILFGFCVLICVGALAAHAIGKRAEDRIFERRFGERGGMRLPSARMPDLHLAERAREAFADHKMPALLAVAGIGLLFGARPGTAIRTASKLVFGRRNSDRARNDDRYDRPRSKTRRR